MKVKILNITRQQRPDGDRYLQVEFDLVRNNKRVEKRTIGIPVDTSEKEIEKQLKAFATQFEEEEKYFKKNENRIKEEEKVGKLIDKYQGKTI